MMRTLPVLGALLAIVAQAQFPQTSTLLLRPGFQEVEINCIVQDAQGLLWAGSDAGLLRSDGAHTRVVFPVSGARVSAIVAAGDDVLAAFSQGLLVRCGSGRCDTLLWDEALRKAPVVGMHADADGTLWMATYGAGLWQLQGGKLKRWGIREGLPDEQLNDLAALPDGRVVVATDQGLAICGRQGVERVFGQAEGAPDNLVLALAVDELGRVVAGTDRQGVFIWDPQAQVNAVELLEATVPMGAVLKVATQAGRIWVSCTALGMVLHEKSAVHGRYERYLAPARLMAQRSALDLFADADGALWWCNGTDLVTRADPAVLWVTDHEGLDLRGISALCMDPQERIWFATPKGIHHHPAAFLDAAQLTRVPLDLDPRRPVVSMAATSDGTVWAATFGNGVYAVRPNGSVQHFTSRDGLLNDNVLAVRCAGNVAWFGTLEGISAYRNGRFTHHRPQGPGFVYDVLPLGPDSAYGATDGNGLVLVHGAGVVEPLQAAGRTYYSMARDAQGRIWAAGPGTGLCAVLGGSTACIGAEHPAFSGDLFGIAALGQRMLVFSDGGAWAYAPSSGSWTELSAQLGIGGVKAGLNTLCNDRHGALWVAMDKGLVRIQDAGTAPRSHIPTRITDVHVGNEAVSPHSALRTTHDRNDLSFQLAAIHYVDPAAVSFEYRLLGYDERSQFTRERQVRYALLPPGSYRFQVRAFVGEPSANSEGWTSFAFVVEAPWYLRRWVLATGLVLLLLLTLLIVRQRERRAAQRQRMEQERVRFQLEALRSQVDPHFLFNSFNTLVALIESDPSSAVGHVDRLSTFFRSILQLRDKELIELREELQLLDSYFALEKERFGEAIELDVEVPDAVLDRQVVPLCLQLLVENALKHNAATRERPLRISVRVKGEELVVTNDLLPRLSPPRSTGFGLHSIRQRYAALTHVPMEAGQEEGRFVVRIPLIIARS